MSKKLNKELINLYNFYKSQKKSPEIVHTIKWFLLEVEGIDPDKTDPNIQEAINS